MTRSIWATWAVGLLLVGCGEQSVEPVHGGHTGGGGSGGSGGGGGTAGAGGAAAAGGASSSVTFIVVEAAIDNGAVTADTDWPVLAGATVAFDAPGGARTEKLSGADGKVTFEGVDWSKGKAAVTAHLPGYSLWSSVNLDPSRLAERPPIEGAPPLILVDLSPPQPKTVTVTGTVTGFQDKAHLLEVSVTQTHVGSAWSGDSGGTFWVAVPSDRPFTLQAFEAGPTEHMPQGHNRPIYQALAQSFDKTTTDISGVVLDFAKSAVTLKNAVASMTTPTRSGSPVRAGFPAQPKGGGLTCSREALYCIGWSEHINIAADGNQFDFSMFWYEPEWVKHPDSFFQVFDLDPDLYSYARQISFRFVNSWPKAGLMGALPDTPEWVTPAEGSSVGHPLHQAIEWKLFDQDVPYVELVLQTGQLEPWWSNKRIWSVEAGANATSLTVPNPPSSVVPGNVFGSALHGQVRGAWLADGFNRIDAAGMSTWVDFAP